MEESKILINPLPLLGYLSKYVLDPLGKQRVIIIIRPGKLDLLSEVMGGGFPEILQALSSAGPRMMATLLVTRPCCIDLFTIPWWNIRCTQNVLENDPMSHIYCGKYPCIPLEIIISIVFSNFYPPINPWTFWLSMKHP